MDIETARKMLEKANAFTPCPRGCTGKTPGCAGCESSAAYVWVASHDKATLAALILALEALEAARCQGCGETHTCRRCKALAAWEAL